MNITIEDVTPFMDPPVPQAKTELVTNWLLAISGQLNATFGTTLPPAIAPTVYDIVGVALNRRLSAGAFDPRIRAQSTGPSSVQYNLNVIALSGWFWPDEANNLDALFGGGGTIQSVRTSAPDAVRFGNRMGPTLTGQLGAPDALALGIDAFASGGELEDELYYESDGDAS